jgi:hypothetical protein
MHAVAWFTQVRNFGFFSARMSHYTIITIIPARQAVSASLANENAEWADRSLQ